MSNGEFCCAIGLCCPPASAQRRMALVSELSHGMAEKSHTPNDETLGHVADWLIANVDMLPKGVMDLSKVLDAMKPKG
jgi:hypothetical protein